MPDRDGDASDRLEDLISAVRSAPRPVWLFDLASLGLVAFSDDAGKLFSVTDERGPRDLLAFVGETDRDAARESLELLRSGAITAYVADRTLRLREGLADQRLFVRAVDGDAPHSHAVATSLEPPDTTSSLRAVAAVTAAVGSVDKTGRIRQVTTDVTELLGYSADRLIGTTLVELVHPSDAAAVRDAFSHAMSAGTRVTMRARVRNAEGAWRAVAVTVGPRSDGRQVFSLAALPDDSKAVTVDHATSDRVADLERHLVRIAREVEAAGLLAPSSEILDPERISGLSELTSRQWQILARLLRGDRVPAIADALYLSASTVRNHLSAIYRKLGVRSQTELIQKLRGNSGDADRGEPAGAR